MLRPLRLAAVFAACTPGRPPAPAPAPVAAAILPAPSDRSVAPAPEVPPAEPRLAPPLSADAALPLAADAGLRVVLDVRAADVLAARGPREPDGSALPDRIVVLEPDYLHVAAHDAATGALLWRTRAQSEPNGWHSLYGIDETLLLHAGPRRIHLDLGTGVLRGTRSAFFHGVDKGCSLHLTSGFQRADPSTWIVGAAGGSACAEECGCSLRLFDCTGATDVGASFHSQTSHLYHSLSEPHDTVCFQPPALLARGRHGPVVRIEDARHRYVVAGLDADRFTRQWTRRELGEAVASREDIGVDPSGFGCWIADSRAAASFNCASGKTRWRVAFGSDADPGHTDVHWHNVGHVIQHRDLTRTWIEYRVANGARRWSRTLAPGRYAVTPGADLDHLYGGAPIVAYTIVHPFDGETRGEIAVVDGQRLLRDTEHDTRDGDGDAYVRVGPGSYAEFDRNGALVRALAHPEAAAIRRVTRDHVIESHTDRLRILRRNALTPALTLPGRWALRDSEKALGRAPILVYEHRDAQPGRAVLLAP